MAVEEIFNNQLFTNLMQKHDNDSTIKVEDYKESKATQQGDNFTCDVFRMSLEGIRKEDGMVKVYKTSIIAKHVPKNKIQAEIYKSKIALVNEKNAYNVIIPALTKYAVDGILPVPKCIQAMDNHILLEDLSLQGYSTIDKSEGGLSVDQCTSVVLALAKLHASSLVLGQKEPKTLEKISKLTQEILFTGGEQLLNSQKCYIELALNTFQDIENKSPNDTKAVTFLSDLLSNYNEVVKSLLKPRVHSVIGHGDAWVGNVMFNKEGDVKLIDLQLMRYNSVAADLCFLFYVNLKPSLSAEYFKPLLEKYMEALKQNTKSQGVDLDEILTDNWISNEMSEFAVYGLMRALWVMPLFFYKPGDIDLSNLSEEVLTDMEYMLSKVGDRYVPRMKELILNYVQNLN